MFGLGMQELIIIFLIVLVLFGAKRIPEIGSSLGKGIKNFKKSFKEKDEEIKGKGPDMISDKKDEKER